ncbi:hypothetical protein AUK40_00005, partial [Candidatus Wirthbacteria bacterium CG2_30_54_11]
MAAITKQERFERRKHRTKTKLEISLSRPRLAVHKSNAHIYAQLIDDAKQQTVVTFTDAMLEALTKEQLKELTSADEAMKDMTPGRKKAYKVGYMVGVLAVSKGVKEIVFDRSGYRYHGLVQ